MSRNDGREAFFHALPRIYLGRVGRFARPGIATRMKAGRIITARIYVKSW